MGVASVVACSAVVAMATSTIRHIGPQLLRERFALRSFFSVAATSRSDEVRAPLEPPCRSGADSERADTVRSRNSRGAKHSRRGDWRGVDRGRRANERRRTARI